MCIPVLRPVSLAILSLGLAGVAQAASYTVPPGAVKLQVTLKGAGGGAGGADSPAADTNPADLSKLAVGGKGVNGASLQVEFPVQAGQVAQYDAGLGGVNGEDWASAGRHPDVGGDPAATPPVRPTRYSGIWGGNGGLGQGAGGAGGDGPRVNTDTWSGSGGGGGGGGASAFTVNGLWARAGGGGGGGGGSWDKNGSDALAGSVAAQATDACKDPLAGTTGAQTSPTIWPLVASGSSGQNGGGGGGGGGGGYLAQAAAQGVGGPSGLDQQTPAAGGAAGGSCYSTAVTRLNDDPAGGGQGQAPGSTTPGDGSVSVVPVMDKSIAKATAGDSLVTLDAPLPPSVPDASAVTGYEFSCTPALGAGNPLVVTAVPTAAMPAVNGTTYTCTVTVSVKDPNGGPDLKLLVSDPVSVTPTATPVVPPVTTGATPVPGLGGAGLVLLSGLVAALGLRRKRNS